MTQDQYVWGHAYVDEMIVRDSNNGSGGNLGIAGSGLGERIYAYQDANYNVTSITDPTGNVLERYMYDPYGKVTVLNAQGTVQGTGSAASSLY